MRRLFLLMLIYGGILLALTGPIGFWGDAWTNFSFGYYYSFPTAVLSFAENIRRPLEGLYITSLYEIFGPEALIFQAGSLILHGMACLLFGRVFHQLQRPQLGTLAALIAFFLPTMAGTSYLTQMDNGRLQMLFFWASVNLWLWSGLQWWRAGLALGLGVLSCFAYEAGILLHLTVPIFLFLAGYESRKKFLFWSILGAFTPLLVFGLARLTLLDGGLVEQQTWLPPLSNYADYTLKALDSLTMGLRSLPSDSASLFLAGLVGLMAGLILLKIPSDSTKPVQNRLILALSGLLFFGGGIPFFWAGGENFIGGPSFIYPVRLYTAGGYGAALFLAWGLAGWQNPRLHRLAQGLGLVFIALGALYHAQLRHDWQAAHASREAVWANMSALVPQVKTHTTLLLIEFQYEEGKATAIGGVTGTQHYLRMRYAEPTLFAHFVYLESPDFRDEEGRRLLIRPEGIFARGRDPNFPAQAEDIILLLRRGETVEIIPALGPADLIEGHPLAADWGEGGELRSNPALIDN